MNSKFDPDKIFKKVDNKSDEMEKVFLVVEGYDLPKPGEKRASFAHGYRLGDENDKIRVRLNTVAERIADKPDEEDKVREQYVKGKFTRPTLSEKAKKNIRYLSFDQAVNLGTNDAGVQEYRAHWSNTVTTDSNDRVIKALAHVRVRGGYTDKKGKKHDALAYMEVVDGIRPLRGDNVRAAVMQALSLENDQGRGRYPCPTIRIHYNGKPYEDGLKFFAFKDPVEIYDENTGEDRTVHENVNAEESLKRLMKGVKSDSEFVDTMNDYVRMVIKGIEDQGKKEVQDEKVVLLINSKEKIVRERAESLYWGAREGGLTFDIMDSHRVYFGPETRKAYIKEAESRKSSIFNRFTARGDSEKTKYIPYVVTEDGEQLKGKTQGELIRKGYSEQDIRWEKTDQTEKIKVPGYTETVIALSDMDNGDAYAVYVDTLHAQPKMRAMKDLTQDDLALTRGMEHTSQVENDDFEQEEPEDDGYEAARDGEPNHDAIHDEEDDPVPF